MTPPRIAAFLIALGGFFGSMAWLATHGPLGHGGVLFVGVYAAGFGAMILLWRLWPRSLGAPAIIFLALLARIALLPFPINDDANRYLWEGYIQTQGHNPYAAPPDAPALAHLRPDFWNGINHKDRVTVYGPFAQLLFRLVAMVWPSLLAMKIAMALFDMGIVVVLLRLMSVPTRLTGSSPLPLRHAVLYALNPLVLLAGAGEGHLESVAVFWSVVALWAFVNKRHAVTFLAMGLAVMTKITPIVFLPFLVTRQNLRFLPFVAIPGLLFLPFAGEGAGVIAAHMRFLSTTHFNGPLWALLSPVVSESVLRPACWTTCAVVCAGAFLLVSDRLKACLVAGAALLLCSPTLHPWYLLLLAPLLVIHRSPSLLLLQLTVACMFPVYARYWETGVWRTDAWMLAAELLPVLVLGAWELWRGARHGLRTFSRPQSVSVVIPTLNEEPRLRACIDSVRSQSGDVVQIIVADGGSADATLSIASSMADVEIVRSARGRGVQIRAGVDRARGDVVVVLHADSRLRPGALGRMIAALVRSPHACGGAFGACYDDSRMSMHAVAAINNARARILGIAFGDQAQFFRRGALDGGFPAQVLMEDIELSFRVKASGATVFVPRSVTTSTRRWHTIRYGRNFVKVFFLSTIYVVQRRFGLVRDNGRWYYRAYYGVQP